MLSVFDRYFSITFGQTIQFGDLSPIFFQTREKLGRYIEGGGVVVFTTNQDKQL